MDMSEFMKRIEGRNIFPHNVERCNEVAQNVINCWYTFSDFIPNFLESLNKNIINPDIKERVNEIIFEERGEGNYLNRHSRLFSLSFEKMNKKVLKIDLESIPFLENEFCRFQGDQRAEAFSVGVSFGLEIIAEENIEYLLNYCSSSEKEVGNLSETNFFKIHRVNEVEHISKCFENYANISSDNLNREAFFEGANLSLLFWEKFWNEAVYVQ